MKEAGFFPCIKRQVHSGFQSKQQQSPGWHPAALIEILGSQKEDDISFSFQSHWTESLNVCDKTLEVLNRTVARTLLIKNAPENQRAQIEGGLTLRSWQDLPVRQNRPVREAMLRSDFCSLSPFPRKDFFGAM